MYPIFPTVDLKEENIYNLEEPHILCLKNQSLSHNERIHTLIHLNDDNFDTERDISRLIMFAFGSAHAQAQLFRNNLEIDSQLRLKQPIVVNAVSLNHQRFNFVTYQLNTLNLRDNSGVKNLAFYDTNNELYYNRPTIDKLPYPSMKNMQRLALRQLEYNPEVFRKFLSVLFHGAASK
jgi:hypothetical protein